MPRSSATDAALTRERILHAVVDRASTEGLSHVSTRSIARDVGLSSSGALGPFASRESLLREALDVAVAEFVDQVVLPSLEHDAGPARLGVIVERWLAYLTHCPFRGGCVVTAVSVDLDGRPGELRDATRDAVGRWRRFLADQFRAAGRSDVEAVDDAVALMGVAMALNQEIQLLGESGTALERGRRTMRAVIDRRSPC
ncbi:MAG: TetR/AcrR family transcriptional regulator [Nocardioides sp.]|uniref:TetR/AcrR family transcriptional regulator n=1 Tax=Nocardioides sp. TaxID=35761 RepID=UPI0039E276DB